VAAVTAVPLMLQDFTSSSVASGPTMLATGLSWDEEGLGILCSSLFSKQVLQLSKCCCELPIALHQNHFLLYLNDRPLLLATKNPD
jgi:hypothetical protein